MIHLFHGEDEFSLREELAALKSQLDVDGMLVSNTAPLDGRTIKPAELLGVCATVPFLGDHRLVVVEGLLGLFESRRFSGKRREGRGSRESIEPWKAVPAALAEMPESTILVFVDGELSASNPLLRLLAPVAEVRHFEPPRQRAVPDWIRDRAAKLELSISPPAVSLLAELVGNDLRGLSQELEKLATYAGDRQIEEDDVKALVSGAREASVLAMVDAVVEGRGVQAVRLLEQLRAEGASSTMALNMITRQYRNLILAKELTLAHLSPAEIGQRLGIKSDFAFRKVLEQSRRHSMTQLEAAFCRLVEADAAIKRGIYDEDLAVDILLDDLSKPSGPSPTANRAGGRRAVN
jgi:DNA polymerase-3 subunit delta